MNVNDFVESINIDDDLLLNNIRKFSEENDIPIVSREVAGLLKLILSFKKPNKILEIGTAIGYSAILMSRFLQDNSSSFLLTIERSPKMIELARKNIAQVNFNKIKLVYSEAEDILNKLRHNIFFSFDVIFLDAAKGQYLKLLPACIEILNYEGILIADDVLQNGYTCMGRYEIPRRQRTIQTRMKKFIQDIFKNRSLDSHIFKVGDGVIVSTKKNIC